MSEMKTLTMNGKTYDSFVDKEAREAIENLELGGGVIDEQIVTGAGVTAIVALTQAEYDALEEKSATTLYIITDATSDDTGNGDDEGGSDGNDTPTNMVPYLLSDGNCYVDTGYIGTVNDVLELTYRDCGIDGEYGSPGTPYCGGWRTTINYAGSRYVSAIHSSKYLGYKPTDPSKKAVIKRDPTTMYYDGEVVGTAEVGDNAEARNLIIFGQMNDNSLVKCTHQLYFYGLKIWQGENLVHNYQPAQDSEGVACVYDAITKTYLYNGGEGTLTYGTEVEES